MTDKDLIKDYLDNGDDSSFIELLNRYQGLIVNIAKEYCYEYSKLDDLISDGRMGFLNAVRHYDLDSNASFGSYASNFIRGEILKGIKSNSLVNIPDHIYRKYSYYREKEDEFYQEYGYSPNSDDLADFIGDVSKEDIEEVYSYFEQKTSIGGHEVETVVAGSYSEDSEEEQQSSIEWIDKYRDILTDKQYAVLVAIENAKEAQKNNPDILLYAEARKYINLSEHKMRYYECIALGKIQAAIEKEKDHNGEDR